MAGQRYAHSSTHAGVVATTQVRGYERFETLREDASLSMTSMPPFRAMATTQFWLPKSRPHGKPIVLASSRAPRTNARRLPGEGKSADADCRTVHVHRFPLYQQQTRSRVCVSPGLLLSCSLCPSPHSNAKPFCGTFHVEIVEFPRVFHEGSFAETRPLQWPLLSVFPGSITVV